LSHGACGGINTAQSSGSPVYFYACPLRAGFRLINPAL